MQEMEPLTGAFYWDVTRSQRKIPALDLHRSAGELHKPANIELDSIKCLHTCGQAREVVERRVGGAREPRLGEGNVELLA